MKPDSRNKTPQGRPRGFLCLKHRLARLLPIAPFHEPLRLYWGGGNVTSCLPSISVSRRFVGICGIVRGFHSIGSDMADKKKGSSPSKSSGGMNKKEAVEKGLQSLGYSATPMQLQKHIREHYKIEMGLKHISTAKAKIVKEAGANKPASTKTTATATTSPAKQSAAPKPASRSAGPKKTPAPQSGGTPGIRLHDIETVKDLVERVGANSLKKLIDVLAR